MVFYEKIKKYKIDFFIICNFSLKKILNISDEATNIGRNFLQIKQKKQT